MERAFADRLSELRRERGLTLREFAETFSAKESTVRDWLNARVLPRAEALAAIARHFGVSVDWLLGIENGPKRPIEWRSRQSFSDELADAVRNTIVRRRLLSSELIAEFFIDGEVALLTLSTLVASSIEDEANRIARTADVQTSLEILQTMRDTLTELSQASKARSGSSGRRAKARSPLVPESPLIEAIRSAVSHRFDLDYLADVLEASESPDEDETNLVTLNAERALASEQSTATAERIDALKRDVLRSRNNVGKERFEFRERVAKVRNSTR